MTSGPETGSAGVTPRLALRGLCPRCGARTLFAGLATFAPRCRACGLDFAGFNVGDGPAAFLIFIVGGIVVALAIALELSAAPPWWVHVLLWLPLTAILTIGLLRLAKGLLLALEWHRAARGGSGRRMKRLPLIPTLIVAAAVAAMIALGIWQLAARGVEGAAARRLCPRRRPARGRPRSPARRAAGRCRRSPSAARSSPAVRRDAAAATSAPAGTRADVVGQVYLIPCRPGADGLAGRLQGQCRLGGRARRGAPACR